MENREKLLSEIEKSLLKLKEEHKITFREAIAILETREEDKKESLIPISAFNNSSLSALETTVKYLKENVKLGYKEIAAILGRNYDPIAITYRNSKKKMPRRLDDSSTEKVPVSIFRESRLSVLENLSRYLKEERNLSYHEIAILLRRDDRTIWTVYSRSRKKLGLAMKDGRMNETARGR